MLIGITGQIGSGKSTAAGILKKWGAFVISADEIGRQVVRSNEAVKNRLVEKFGRRIITPRGNIRRRLLGRLAFASPDKKVLLNKIVHPYLLKELGRQTRQALKKYRIVVVDAALLIDWGWHKRVDLTILVNCNKDKKIARLICSGLTRQEALQRLEAQLSYRILRAYADIVLSNNRDKYYLEKQLLRIWKSKVTPEID